MNSIKLNLLSTIGFPTILLLTIWSLTPMFFRNLPFSIVFFLYGISFFLIMLFLLSSRKIKFKKLEFLIVSLIGVWLTVTFIYAIYQMPNFSFGNYIYVFLYFSPILFFISSNYIINQSTLNKGFMVVTVCIFLNAVSNIFILSTNPFAAKEATGNYGLIDYSTTNVITDTFIFSYVVFLYLLLIIWKSGKNSIFTSILIALLTILILQSTFFIALSTLIVMLTIKVLWGGANQFNKLGKYFSFLITITFFLIFKSSILENINNLTRIFTDNYIVLHRVEAATNFLNNFSTIGTLEARFEDLKISFLTFLEYPLFGKGFIVSDHIVESGIGMHSHFFDTLARFGIVGFLIELSIYILFYIYTKNLISVNYIKDYTIIYIGFFWYSLFNPIVYPAAGMMMFLIIPLVLKGVKSSRVKEKKNVNANYPANL